MTTTYTFEVTYYNGVTIKYTCNAETADEALVIAKAANLWAKTIQLL